MLKVLQFMSKHKLPGRKLLSNIEFMRVFWKLTNNPNNTATVFELNDVLMVGLREIPREQLLQFLVTKEYYREMLADRYLAPKYKIEDLKGYAPGTLGHAYYSHMTGNGFSLDFYPPTEVTDELSYIVQRSNETHDIWHVVTGYGVDVVSEIALQAFYFGQTEEDSFAMLLMAVGCLNAVIHAPQNMTRLMRGIVEGYERGRRAKSFYPVQWETMWNRSLEEIRAELNVDASPSVTVVEQPVEALKELAYAAASK